MDKTQSDLIVWYKLETEFFHDHVRHTRYVAKAKNRNEKVREDWSNCEEIGRGGFGVVHKQMQETTGHYRAVKAIDKRLHPKVDYSREILVMSILGKVCVLTSEGYFCCGLTVGFLASVTICGVPRMVREARDFVYRNGIFRRRRSHQAYRYTATTRNRSNYFKADTRRPHCDASTWDSSSGSKACGIITSTKHLTRPHPIT